MNLKVLVTEVVTTMSLQWGIFFIIVISLLVYAAYKFVSALRIFHDGNRELEQVNVLSKKEPDQAVENFEKKAAEVPFLRRLMSETREIAKSSKELSLVDVHALTDDLILSFEERLNLVASIFFLVGITFTVIGLLMALAPISDIANVASTEGIISGLVNNFLLAFGSTIIGAIFSVITKLGQLKIKRVREQFHYNFLLYVKNVIIPVYSIPEVERDLGKLVRTLTKSSSSLRESADLLGDLSRSTQLGTEQIVQSVEGFTAVTERMGLREERLTSVLGNLSNYLTDLRASIQEIVAPIDLMREDLINKDQSIELQVEFIRKIHDKQLEFDRKVQNGIDDIRNSIKRIADFFDQDFTDSFEQAMSNLTADQKTLLEAIHKNTSKIRSSVKSLQGLSGIDREISALREGLATLQDRVETDFSAVKSSIAKLRKDNKAANKGLISEVTGLGKTSVEMSDLVSRSNDVAETVRSQIELMIGVLDHQSDDETGITMVTLHRIEQGLGTVVESMNSLNSLTEQISKLEEAITSQSPTDTRKFFKNPFRS